MLREAPRPRDLGDATSPARGWRAGEVTQRRRRDPERVRDDSFAVQLAAMEENGRWFAEHFDTLMVRHPDSWVAFRKGKVLATAGDQLALLEALTEKGIPMTGVTVELLSTGPFVG